MLVDFTNTEGISYVPQQATPVAAAYDIKAAERKRLMRGKVILVPTGLAVSVPNGYVLLLCNRSSLGRKGIILANGVGVIDPDYRGELFVPLLNTGDDTFVDKGERVAQLLLLKTESIIWNFVETLTPTERGEGGFGSTGSF